MRYLLFAVIFACQVAGFAQVPVSQTGDKEMEALMNKVEKTTEKGGTYTSVYQVDASIPSQVEVAEFSEKYFKAMIADDLTSTYQMMSKDYRAAVSLQNYLRKDHIKLLSVELAKVEFGTDTCARLLGSTRSVAGRLGEVAIPLRLRIFKEDGKWVVYSNPYEQVGFTLPKAKDIVFPCEF